MLCRNKIAEASLKNFPWLKIQQEKKKSLLRLKRGQRLVNTICLCAPVVWRYILDVMWSVQHILGFLRHLPFWLIDLIVTVSIFMELRYCNMLRVNCRQWQVVNVCLRFISSGKGLSVDPLCGWLVQLCQLSEEPDCFTSTDMILT